MHPKFCYVILILLFFCQDWSLLHSPGDLASLGRLTRLRKLSLVTPYEEHLSVDGLLALTQLRLLSLSPSPAMARYDQVRGESTQGKSSDDIRSDEGVDSGACAFGSLSACLFLFQEL